MGRLSGASVLETRLTFSKPSLEPTVEVRGVTIPEGLGYGPVFMDRNVSCGVPDDEVVVDLDVAIRLFTDSGNAVTIFTDAVSYFVHLSLDRRIRADWETHMVERRIV